MRSLLVLLVLLLLTPTAAAQTVKKSMEVLGFDEAREHFLLKVEEEGVGSILQVRKLFQGRMVEEQFYAPDQEEQAIARMKRKHRLTVEPHVGSKTPDEKYALMGFKDKKFFRLFVMADEQRVGYYDRVELKKNDKGGTGKAYLKETYWTPDGKYFVPIIHQELSGTRLDLDADQFYLYKFRRYRIKFRDGGAQPAN
jgi:hypothetical protein